MGTTSKVLLTLGGVAVVAGAIGVVANNTLDNAVGNIVIDASVNSYEKASLNVITSDIESGDLVAQDVYVVASSGKGYDVTSNTEFADTLIIGNTYTAYLLDTSAYGSDFVFGNNMNEMKIAGEGVEFVMSPEGTDLRLEVNLISDTIMKAEDNINGDELYIGASTGYEDADTVVFDSDASGSNISVEDSFEATVFIKPDTSDAVANDNGLLIVMSSDANNFEDESIRFNGQTLTQLTSEQLKDNFADVNYDNFRTMKVFMVDESVEMVKNQVYEMTVGAELIDGASVEEDITVDVYALGYIKTADGVELSALDSAGDSLHADVDKHITFNIFD